MFLNNKSSLQCYTVLSTIAQVSRKMKLKTIGILIFDDLFIRDLRIVPEGENMSIHY